MPNCANQVTCQSFLEVLPDGVIITDARRRVIAVNADFVAITGQLREALIGRPLDYQETGHELIVGEQELWYRLGRECHWQGELNVRRENGEGAPVRLSIRTLYDDSRKPTHHVGILRNLSEHKQQLAMLDQMQQYDSLTGLPSSALFRRELQEAIELCDLNKHQVAVVVVGLESLLEDRFLTQYDATDRQLLEFSQALKKFSRWKDGIGRIGSNRVAMIVPQVSLPEQLIPLISDILKITLPTQPRNLNIKLGISLYPYDGENAETLLTRAHAAYSSALQQPEKNYQYFSGGMNALVKDQVRLTTNLREALKNNELELHYQPRVELASGSITGVEALLRWQHPQRGRIPPSDLLPLAELQGLMAPIGYWTLHTACEQIQHWRQAGLSPIPVALNLSASQLADPELVSLIRQAINDYQLAPEQLEFEISEQVVARNPAQAAQQLKQLKALGVGLVLEDAGSSTLTIADLCHLPVDRLKISRQLIHRSTGDDQAQHTIKALVALAEGLNKKVTASGVESEAHLKLLDQLGCAQAQGYFFSRAVDAPTLTQILQQGTLDSVADSGSPPSLRTLLLVDDEPKILHALYRTFRKQGFRLLLAEGGAQALELLSQESVQVIISDQCMPGMSGIELFERMKEQAPDTVRLILSGYADMDAITTAIDQGLIYKFLSKPWEAKELLQITHGAFDKYESQVTANAKLQ